MDVLGLGFGPFVALVVAIGFLVGVLCATFLERLEEGRSAAAAIADAPHLDRASSYTHAPSPAPDQVSLTIEPPSGSGSQSQYQQARSDSGVNANSGGKGGGGLTEPLIGRTQSLPAPEKLASTSGRRGAYVKPEPIREQDTGASASSGAVAKGAGGNGRESSTGGRQASKEEPGRKLSLAGRTSSLPVAPGKSRAFGSPVVGQVAAQGTTAGLSAALGPSAPAPAPVLGAPTRARQLSPSINASSRSDAQSEPPTRRIPLGAPRGEEDVPSILLPPRRAMYGGPGSGIGGGSGGGPPRGTSPGPMASTPPMISPTNFLEKQLNEMMARMAAEAAEKQRLLRQIADRDEQVDFLRRQVAVQSGQVEALRTDIGRLRARNAL
eukprot:jgi/Mesen1/2797/ME000172S01949